MRTLTERFTRLMSELMGEWPGVGMLAGMSSPLGELEELDDAYLVRLELPGSRRATSTSTSTSSWPVAG
jgi:HSP20 family molecular chaperone IbpA